MYHSNFTHLLQISFPDINEGFFCGVLEDCEAVPVLETIITLSNLLMVINSAANFLMYMVSQSVSRSGAPILIRLIIRLLIM